MSEYTVAKIYFGILGIVTVLFGIAELNDMGHGGIRYICNDYRVYT